MHKPGDNKINVRRVLHGLAMMTVLGLAAVGLTQCRVVKDTVTGVDFGATSFHGRENCNHKCNDDFKRSMDREEDRHHGALRACEKIKQDNKRHDCKRSEDKVHNQNVDKIQDTKKKCKHGCYNEGGGHAGR
jgi:hypothetical protein